MAKDKSLGADGKPKYFMSEDKANNFIERKSLSETHKVLPDDDGKFHIVPKE